MQIFAAGIYVYFYFSSIQSTRFEGALIFRDKDVGDAFSLFFMCIIDRVCKNFVKKTWLEKSCCKSLAQK
jgi:hypothetical protein